MRIISAILISILILVCVVVVYVATIVMMQERYYYVGEEKFPNIYQACAFAEKLQTQWEATNIDKITDIDINDNVVKYIFFTNENQTFQYGERQGINYSGFIIPYGLFGCGGIWLIWAFGKYVIKYKKGTVRSKLKRE